MIQATFVLYPDDDEAQFKILQDLCIRVLKHGGKFEVNLKELDGKDYYEYYVECDNLSQLVNN